METTEFLRTVLRRCKYKNGIECGHCIFAYRKNSLHHCLYDELYALSTKGADNEDYFGTLVKQVEQWSEDHPVETRADKFFELFPDACNFYPADPFPYKKIPDFCPNRFAGNLDNLNCFARNDCVQCKVNFWLAEASE